MSALEAAQRNSRGIAKKSAKKKVKYCGLHPKKTVAPTLNTSPNIILRASDDGVYLNEYSIRRNQLANHLPLLNAVFRAKECNTNYDTENKVVHFLYPYLRGQDTTGLDNATLDRIFVVEGFLERCKRFHEHNYHQISHLSVEDFWRSFRLVAQGIKTGAVLEDRPIDHLHMAIEVAKWMGASAKCLRILNQGIQASEALSLSIKKRALEKERQAEEENRVRQPSLIEMSRRQPSDNLYRLYIVYTSRRNAARYDIEVLLNAHLVFALSRTLCVVADHKLSCDTFDPDRKVLRLFPSSASPNMSNAIINLNNLIKVSHLPLGSQKWWVSHIDGISDENIASGLGAFFVFVEDAASIEKHTCTDLKHCLQHLSTWFVVGKWLGAISFRDALTKKIGVVTSQLEDMGEARQS